MSQKLDLSKKHERYPVIKQLSSEGLEFSMGDGWYPIIERLLHELGDIMTSQQLDPQDYGIVQVKEKFGLLRVYMDNSNDEMSLAIGRAVDASCKICEQCGKEGKLYVEGWARTSCEECQNAYREKKGIKVKEYREVKGEGNLSV